MSALLSFATGPLGRLLLATLAGAAIAWTLQGWRLDAVKAEFKGFVDTTRAIGEAAQQAAIATAKADHQRKEHADAENITTLDRLRADNQRLRDARAGRSFLPAAAPGARSPATACFDRPELERSLRDFDRGITGLIDEGDEARVNLDTAKRWALP